MALVIILLVAFAIMIIWSANVKKKEEDRDAAAEKASEKVNEEFDRFAKESEEWRRSFNDSYREDLEREFKAWEERFCTSDNPGYKIAGINFKNLSDKHLGAFKGTIRREEWNAFDDKAIAIYQGSKKVGYIAKEDREEILSHLSNQDGKAVCYGCIYRWMEDDEDCFDSNLIPHFAGKIVLDLPQGVSAEAKGDVLPGTESGQIISINDENTQNAGR